MHLKKINLHPLSWHLLIRCLPLWVISVDMQYAYLQSEFLVFAWVTMVFELFRKNYALPSQEKTNKQTKNKENNLKHIYMTTGCAVLCCSNHDYIRKSGSFCQGFVTSMAASWKGIFLCSIQWRHPALPLTKWGRRLGRRTAAGPKQALLPNIIRANPSLPCTEMLRSASQWFNPASSFSPTQQPSMRTHTVPCTL